MSFKTALVLDANVLENNNKEESFSSFDISAYDDAIGLLERYELGSVCILIPEIVIEELGIHKVNKLKSTIAQLESICSSLSGVNEIEISKNIEDVFQCERHIEAVQAKKINELRVIPIPTDKEKLFEKILNMALKKIPPFKKGSSDQGFKDAILLISLSDFAKNFDCPEYVLFTADKGFESEKIVEAFKKETGKDLKIIAGKDIQGYISDKFDLFIEFKKYLNEEFYPKIEERISKLTDIVADRRQYQIASIEINPQKTTIEEISSGNYQVNLALSAVVDNDLDREFFTIDDIIKPYEFNKNEEGIWEINEGKCNYILT